jgi:membrane-bound lytic murein transglycosylase D
LRIKERGRASVRGQRPDGASIHVAYVAPAHNEQAALYADLASFEDARFPAGTPQTIIDRPPERWMAELTLPDLPIRWNQRTVEYLRYFRDNPRGQALIRGWIKRMGRYEHMIRPILREVGVPEGLAFVAMAESGFNPTRRSRVGAVGMWQFMEGTGRVYGLDTSYWIDERRDLERSTYAAASYLKDLRVRFGSWELALAAFNAGYARVMQAVTRHNTNNFWALCEIESGLPYGTTNYVPKIMAAALVGSNRAVFHVDGERLTQDPSVRWISVQAPGATSLKTVASSLGADRELIREINARYRRGRTPPGGDYFPIRIPERLAARYQSVSRVWRRDATRYKIHEVRYGETLARVARRYGTTVRALKKLNGLESSAELARGVFLLVPRKAAKSSGKKRGSAAARKGDETPLAAVPSVDPGPARRLVFFEVTRATTPRGLTETFGATWTQLVAWNDLDPQARLQSGQVLQIVVPADFSAVGARATVFERDEVEYVLRGSKEHIEASLRRRGLVRRAYNARRGEKLSKIGKKFDLSVGSLARINGFSRTYTPVRGERIIVYVPKGKTRGTVKAPPPKPTTITPEAEASNSTSESSSKSKSKSSKSKSKSKSKSSKSKSSKSSASRRDPSTARTSRIPGSKEP